MTGHRARKRFGQNFLTDQHVVARIVDAIQPRADDHMVEIGPGLGALTEALLARVDALDAIELDRDLIPKLAQRCAHRGRLHIHAADALRFDFSTLVRDHQPLRIVGNLPYNISTPLMFHLLASKAVIRDMHFMLQKEVVDRLAAGPDSRDYGRLSVMIQYHCRVEALFEVAPQAFSPAPKVNSAVVRLTPYTQPPVKVADEALLASLVTRAFAMRRKTLRNNLKGLADQALCHRVGIDDQRRAETLSLAEFAALTNAIAAGETTPT